MCSYTRRHEITPKVPLVHVELDVTIDILSGVVTHSTHCVDDHRHHVFTVIY